MFNWQFSCVRICFAFFDLTLQTIPDFFIQVAWDTLTGTWVSVGERRWQPTQCENSRCFERHCPSILELIFDPNCSGTAWPLRLQILIWSSQNRRPPRASEVGDEPWLQSTAKSLSTSTEHDIWLHPHAALIPTWFLAKPSFCEHLNGRTFLGRHRPVPKDLAKLAPRHRKKWCLVKMKSSSRVVPLKVDLRKW